MSNNKGFGSNNNSTTVDGSAAVDQDKIRAAQEAVKAEMNGEGQNNEAPQQEAPQKGGDSFALAKAEYAKHMTGMVQTERDNAIALADTLSQVTGDVFLQTYVENEAEKYKKLGQEGGLLQAKHEATKQVVLGFTPKSLTKSRQTTSLKPSQTNW